MSIATKGVHRRRPEKASLQSDERLKRYAYIFGFAFFLSSWLPPILCLTGSRNWRLAHFGLCDTRS